MPDTVSESFKLVPMRVACTMLCMDQRTIRELADLGLLDFVETPKGHRRYAIHAYILREIEKNRVKAAA
jgi:hypothetical protein